MVDESSFMQNLVKNRPWRRTKVCRLKSPTSPFFWPLLFCWETNDVFVHVLAPIIDPEVILMDSGIESTYTKKCVCLHGLLLKIYKIQIIQIMQISPVKSFACCFSKPHFYKINNSGSTDHSNGNPNLLYKTTHNHAMPKSTHHLHRDYFP